MYVCMFVLYIDGFIVNKCIFSLAASDIILSHMITFLNDKRDWKLRAEFYQCIVGVASYIGWQSTSVLQPLIEQVRHRDL